jgi:hypothetical protein
VNKVFSWFLKYWNWFLYFRQGRIKYKVWAEGDIFCACASDGKLSVWNCYGTTPEAAKEMAKYKLKKYSN